MGWPGTQALDRVSHALAARLSRRSPLLARVVADGTYLRAILGSASLLGLLGGFALGLAAVHDTGGDAPAAVLTIAIAVLGVFDAAAGLLAVLTFVIGGLVLGGMDTNADLRVMLVLSALWVVVPLLAGAVRPLRRSPTRGLEESWERAADFVIASLIGSWAVQSLMLALPGLAGLQLPIADHANAAALCVLAALVCRLGFETIAAHAYPRRLDVLPKGLVEIVLMLFVVTAFAALLFATMDEDSRGFLANSFVLLALTAFMLSLLRLFGREGDERTMGWGKRIAGVGLLLAGIFFLGLGLAL